MFISTSGVITEKDKGTCYTTWWGRPLLDGIIIVAVNLPGRDCTRASPRRDEDGPRSRIHPERRSPECSLCDGGTSKLFTVRLAVGEEFTDRPKP